MLHIYIYTYTYTHTHINGLFSSFAHTWNALILDMKYCLQVNGWRYGDSAELWGYKNVIFVPSVLTTLATVSFVFFLPLFEDTGGDVVQTVRRHFGWPVQSDHKRNRVVKPVFLFSAQNTHSCSYILCSAVFNICDPVCEIIHPLAQNFI
jgi:hypothetical protein